MRRRASWIALMLVALGLVIASLVWVLRSPTCHVRITRRLHPATAPSTLSVTYIRPHPGRTPDEFEHVDTEFSVANGVLWADVPLRRWDMTLYTITFPGEVALVFPRLPSDATHSTRRAQVTLAEAPAAVGVEGHASGALDIVLDDRPLTVTTLRPPDGVEPEPGPLPTVTTCLGGNVVLSFDVEPWPVQEADIRAVVVRPEAFDYALRHTHRGVELPRVMAPNTFTHEDWRELRLADELREGHAGGTPTLALDHAAHTVTFWAQPGAPDGRLDLDAVVVVVGTFEPDRPSAIVGAVRIDVANDPCAAP